jgi:hypothetical protein
MKIEQTDAFSETTVQVSSMLLGTLKDHKTNSADSSTYKQNTRERMYGNRNLAMEINRYILSLLISPTDFARIRTLLDELFSGTVEVKRPPYRREFCKTTLILDPDGIVIGDARSRVHTLPFLQNQPRLFLTDFAEGKSVSLSLSRSYRT